MWSNHYNILQAGETSLLRYRFFPYFKTICCPNFNGLVNHKDEVKKEIKIVVIKIHFSSIRMHPNAKLNGSIVYKHLTLPERLALYVAGR